MMRTKQLKITTADEITDMLMELSDEDFKKQRNILTNYFGSDYGRDLNRFLSDPDQLQYLYERPDFEKDIQQLDAAMVPITKPIISERYVTEMTLPGLDIKNPKKLVGKTISNPGYLSSTIDALNSKFEFSNYPAKIILQAPAGTRAILGANLSEAEILYDRNYKYKIFNFSIGKNQYGHKQIIYYAKLLKK